MKVPLDTNVWLAVLTRRGVCRRFWRLLRREHEVFSGDWVVEEVAQKLPSKFKTTERQATQFARFVKRATDPVQLSGSVPAVSRDPDDDEVLALALAAQSEFLIIGDKDLLVLDGYKAIRIVTVRAFASEMGWQLD